MNIQNIINKLKSHEVVLAKNKILADTLSDIIIYYLKAEPEHPFSKAYQEQIGNDFKYEIALNLYLTLVQKLNVKVEVDKFYTKITPYE